jgi:hypothetical protein
MKTHPNSLEAKLQIADLYDEFMRLLFDEHWTYKKVKAWLKGEGLETSDRAMSELFTTKGPAWHQKRCVMAADELRKSLPEDVSEKVREYLGAQLYRLGVTELGPNEWASLQYVLQGEQRLDLEERKLALKEKELQIKERRQSLAEKKLEAAKSVATDTSLTPEQRQTKWREILGLPPEPAAPTQPTA